jgi:glycosyltransferase involved in cell wall biosynthesis
LSFFKLIIFIIPYHPIGGAERVHLAIIKSLKYKPIVLFDSANYQVIGTDFEESAYCFLLSSKRRRKFALKLVKILSSLIPVTIFGCNSRTFYNFVSSLKDSVRSIDLTHAFSYPEIGIEVISLPYVDFIETRVVINQKTKDDYQNLYKKNNINLKLADRIIIIPNGIKIANFVNTIESRFEHFTIGFVGRNSPEKRPELFFDIVKKFNVRTKVIGDDFERYKKDFPSVTFLENCNDAQTIRRQFSTVSILVVPSSREGFPLVIMEAMELGIPVIAADVGSISEHVINGENGYVGAVDAAEFLNFSTDLIRKISNDKELYSQLSLNSRAYASVHFNVENFSIRYRKLFYE